jgi:hypothetical protein
VDDSNVTHNLKEIARLACHIRAMLKLQVARIFPFTACAVVCSALGCASAQYRRTGGMTWLRERSLIFAILAIALPILGTGCTSAPVGELTVFRESVTTANGAATPLLDELSAAEKRIKRNATATLERNLKTAPTFRPADYQYYADIGDGPATAVFRRGHNVLDRLSEVLLMLATGASATADVAALQGLASAAGGLLNVVGVGIAAGPAFEVLKPALEELSKESSRRQARLVINQVESQHFVQNLVDALISATPAMFAVLTSEAERRASRGGASFDAEAAFADRVAKVRILLSNYIVLLRQTATAWNEAVKAVDSGASASVVTLTERVTELRAAALTTRKAFADLNAGQ